MNPRHNVVSLSVIAFALRFAVLVWFPIEPRNADMDRYLEQSYYLATQHSFAMNGVPTAFNGPAYPLVLALFGRNLRAVQLLFVLCGTATVILTYHLARTILDRKWSYVAGLAMALAPMSVRFSSVLLTETLYTLLITAAIYCWAKHRNKLSGVAFGLSLLVRPLALVFIPFTRKWTIVLVACAVMLPWAVRNWYQFGKPMLVSAGVGQNLLIGTIDFDRSSWQQINDTQFFGDELDALSETERDNARRDLALQRIAANPVLWVKARAKQYPALFADQGQYLFDGPGLRKTIVRTAFLSANFVFICLSIFGIWLLRRDVLRFDYLVFFPVYVALVHLPMWCEARYSLPAVPEMIILSTIGVRSLPDLLIRADKFSTKEANP